MNTDKVINVLLNSDEPSIRFKTRVNVLSEEIDSPEFKALQNEIKNSGHVKKILSFRDRDGRITRGRNVYDKWKGSHWVLSSLADIGYPQQDRSLIPLKDQVLDFWLKEYYFTDIEVIKKSDLNNKTGVPVISGKHRRCASMQGNALFFLTKLGLFDKRLDSLAERLLHWQWDDGGWNCDKNPEAKNSSYMESLLPLRGLSIYSKYSDNKKIHTAVKKAAEIFLKRKLFRKVSDGSVMKDEFLSLHYPLYWHYDILGGLKAMAEAGFIKDRRCSEALDILESKALPTGGWAAEKKYYTVSDEFIMNADSVGWGETGKRKFNEWVTADALYVLKAAGRI
ncbi:MAG: hypothetical protein IPM96_18455 [Ignavibacteria bacterium]|nr:hypothetical protein [Ignavibacteria bacterium]